MTHYMKLRPHPFAMIESGQKTVELRLLDDKRKQIALGDTIIFCNTDSGAQIVCRVKNLHVFASFDELYRTLPLDLCGYMPDELANASAKDMEQYYPAQEQAQYGVIGIEITLI